MALGKAGNNIALIVFTVVIIGIGVIIALSQINRQAEGIFGSVSYPDPPAEKLLDENKRPKTEESDPDPFFFEDPANISH